MSKAKFDVAKEHIKEGEYSEALAILKTIDHPTARAWEAKIEKLLKPSQNLGSRKPSKATKHREWLWVFAGFIVFGCGICSVLMVMSSNQFLGFQQGTSTAKAATAIAFVLTPPSETPTTTATPTVTSTLVPSLTPTDTSTVTPSVTSTFTYTPKPTATATVTETPTATDTDIPTDVPSVEDQARDALESVIGNNVERLIVTELNSPQLLAMDYPMPGLFNYDYDRAGHQMLRMACALYDAGFNTNWRFQFSAMVDVVNKATGQQSHRDGLTIWVESSTVARWDCSNTFSMDAALAVDGYSLDPLLQQ